MTSKTAGPAVMPIDEMTTLVYAKVWLRNHLDEGAECPCCRQLAKVFHPDKPGGSTKQMQRVNQAADLLIAQLAARP